MSEKLTSHPAYAEGYWDAMDGEPLFPDASPEYYAGWKAASDAKETLAKGGFSETSPGEFSVTIPFGPAPHQGGR